jgi:hypothetical protein
MDASRMTDIDFEAMLTLDQARAAENDSRIAFGRRVTLLALSKNKSELVDSVRKLGAEPYSAWLDQVEDFQKELKYLLELSDSAHARLIIAGQVIIEETPKH